MTVITDWGQACFVITAVVAVLLVFLVVEVRRIRIATGKIAAKSKTE
jgi:hypothetical protein